MLGSGLLLEPRHLVRVRAAAPSSVPRILFTKGREPAVGEGGVILRTGRCEEATGRPAAPESGRIESLKGLASR